MAAIAAEGDVSKALLHYHFSDRAGLLTEVVLALGRGLAMREQAALEPSIPGGPVDLLWKWLESELERGELQALLRLGAVRDDNVRRALAHTTEARRAAARTSVERVFARLGLAARVPSDLLGDTVVAFTDGLALNREHGMRDTRVSFDVFWLAMLSLGE
jgi:AcrR family transcriptional regulator